jgi:hypothetical protein
MLLSKSNVTIEKGMSEMDCKCGCGQQIEEKPGGHRQRLFVDDAHKMRWHRQQQQNDQQEALLAELAELRTKVADQAHTIASQKHALEVDVWYHLDTVARSLKPWLKNQRKTPLIEKLLADQFLPAKPTSRAMFESYLRSKGYTADDLAEFAHLWKALIEGKALQS